MFDPLRRSIISRDRSITRSPKPPHIHPIIHLIHHTARVRTWCAQCVLMEHLPDSASATTVLTKRRGGFFLRWATSFTTATSSTHFVLRAMIGKMFTGLRLPTTAAQRGGSSTAPLIDTLLVSTPSTSSYSSTTPLHRFIQYCESRIARCLDRTV